jgi:hypothetical protein
MARTVPRQSSISEWLIRPREIHYLRFVLEAYEGLATLTTLQPQLGLIRLNVAPGCEEDVQKILQAEQERLHCCFPSTTETE